MSTATPDTTITVPEAPTLLDRLNAWALRLPPRLQ